MRRLRPVWTLAAAFHVLMSAGAPALADEKAPAAAPPAARDPRGAEKEKARELVMKASDALVAGRFAEAEALFAAAWELEKTYDIAGNLGNVELINNKPREAAEHLRFCLSSLPPSEPKSQQQRVKARFEEARRLVAALHVSVSEPGAAIRVDGRPAGVAPLQLEIFADPGPRVVSAELAGFEPAQITVNAEKGGSHDISLELKPEPLPPPASRAPSTSPGRGPERERPAPPPSVPSRPPLVAGGPNLPLLYTGSAIALGALGTGIGLSVVTNRVADEVTTTRQALIIDQGPDACVPGKEPALRDKCLTLEAKAKEQNKLEVATIGAFTTAGAAAAGVALYVLIRHASDGETTVLPSVTRNAGALVLTGVW